MARFPSPYLNDCKADDPMLERVPMEKMGIGANAAGLPNGGVNSPDMMLKHIGGDLGKEQS